MKITVKTKKQLVSLNELKPGTVFKFDNNVVALKLIAGQVLLLNYCTGASWLDLAEGLLTHPVQQILGQITEIIVE